MEAQYWIPTVRRGSQYLDVYSSMLEDGIIFVNAPIDQRIAGLVTSSLLHHAAHGENTRSAKVYLNTKQGDIVSAMSIVDIIELYKKKKVEIQTLGLGEVGVAACLILAAGTPGQRKVARHCQLSLYLGLDSLDLPNLKGADMQLREAERIKAQFLDILERYTGTSVDRFRVRIGSEEYLNADDAQRLCLVDELI